MNNKLAIGALALSFLTGFYSHHFLKEKPRIKVKEHHLNECADHYNKLIADDKKIACRHELEKIQSLYGKAFNLFLINLGLNLSRSNKNDLNKLIESPKQYAAAKKVSDEVTLEEEVTDKSLLSKNDKRFFPHPTSEQLELMSQIEDKDIVLKGLKNTFKDPALALARSEHIKKFKKIKKMNGSYIGKIYFFSGDYKDKTHDVEMIINYFFKENDEKSDIDGSFSLKLISEVGIYSNSQGSGGNGDIRLAHDHIIIEAGPTRFFSFQKDNLDYANFYIKNKHVGFAKFEKN